MNGGGFVPIPMRMVTPEERAQLEREQLEKHKAAHRQALAFLPHLRNARQELREAAGLGVGGDRFNSIRQSLAVLIDDVETSLMEPP